MNPTSAQKPTYWDSFHTDLFFHVKSQDKSEVGGSEGTCSFKINKRVIRMRTMELLAAQIPNCFAPIADGVSATIYNTTDAATFNVVTTRGSYADGLDAATQLTTLFNAIGTAGTWTVTWDAYRAQLLFENDTLTDTTITFPFTFNGVKYAKFLGFPIPSMDYGIPTTQTFNGDGAGTGAALSFYCPRLMDLSGPASCSIVMSGFQTQAADSNNHSVTFYVPITVPYTTVINYDVFTNFRQSLQYYAQGLEVTFSQLQFQVIDEYGNPYPSEGPPWSCTLGFTSWDQEFTPQTTN